MDPWLFMHLAVPPKTLAEIIKLVEQGVITRRMGLRILDLIWQIALNMCFPKRDVAIPEENPYVWYVAGMLAWDAPLELPPEICQIKDPVEVEAFCRATALQWPKLWDLFQEGKKGPLIGKILKASEDRLVPDSFPDWLKT